MPPWAIGPRAAAAASLFSGKECAMRDMIETTLTLLRIDQRGVTAVEYAIIAGVLGAIIVAAFSVLGGNISGALSRIGSDI